jgi:outer membrane biogenesis lipoprotein LolB
MKFYSRYLCLALAVLILSACGVGATAAPKSGEDETLKEQRRKSLPAGEH